MSEKTIVLKTNGLTKEYRDICASKDITFEIKKGTIVGLIGRNGAGKTTIMKMLLNMIAPTSGTMEILGETSPQGLSKARGKIGSIIETPAFNEEMSVYQNLKLRGILIGHSSNEEIIAALKKVDLLKVKNKKIKKLSLGMRQKIGIASAILGEPELLILDEPINGLDPIAIKEIRDIILEEVKNREVTVLISSHILSEMSKTATDYIFINDGQIIKQVSSKEFEGKDNNALEDYFISLVGGINHE